MALPIDNSEFENSRGAVQIEVSKPEQERDDIVRPKPLEVPSAQTLCSRENCVILEVDDADMECEDGASPALLGGFIIPSAVGEKPDLDSRKAGLKRLDNFTINPHFEN